MRPAAFLFGQWLVIGVVLVLVGAYLAAFGLWASLLPPYVEQAAIHPRVWGGAVCGGTGALTIVASGIGMWRSWERAAPPRRALAGEGGLSESPWDAPEAD